MAGLPRHDSGCACSSVFEHPGRLVTHRGLMHSRRQINHVQGYRVDDKGSIAKNLREFFMYCGTFACPFRQDYLIVSWPVPRPERRFQGSKKFF